MQLTQTNQNALFSLSNDQWIGLNRWIGDIVTSGNRLYQSYPSQFPPSFPQAVTCCQQWTASTFSNIDQVASSVLTYSESAINNFSLIQSAFSKLGPADPIPAQLQQQTNDAISELCANTKSIYALFTPVLNDVVSLQNSFTDVDNEWLAATNTNQYFEFCGFIMMCDYLPIPPGASGNDIRDFIADFFNQYINAFQLFNGAWQALESDLSNATSSPIIVTNAFLASLDIANAINNWQNLQNEVSGFSVIKTEAEALWINPDQESPWKTT